MPDFDEPKTPEAPSPAPVAPKAPAAPKPPAPAAPKVAKPPKPAAPAVPPRVQDKLGFYDNARDALRTLKQDKVTPEQLRGHFKGKGTGYEENPPKYTAKEPPPAGSSAKIGDAHPGWTQIDAKTWHNPNGQSAIHGLEDWLKDKPQVTRDQVHEYLADKHPELVEHSQGGQSPFMVRDHDLNEVKAFAERDDAEQHREKRIKEYLEDKVKEKAAKQSWEDHNIYIDDPHSKTDAEWVVRDSLTGDSKSFDSREAAEEQAEEWFNESVEAYSGEWKDRFRDEAESRFAIEEPDGTAKTHYHTWQLPGPSEGYDELHVAAPGVRGATRFVVTDAHYQREHGMGNRAVNRDFATKQEAEKYRNSLIEKHGGDTAESRAEAANRFPVSEMDESAWSDGHDGYSHIENPVVRARHNTRIDADGKKMLFLEELQGPQDPEQENMPPWLRDRIYDIGLKRMLRHAVDNGHERIGWTTGSQQADRWNLAKKVDRLEWEPTANGSGRLHGYKDGQSIVNELMPADKLPEFVGPELHERLMAQTPHHLEGKDLAFGGEGLKTLYDKMLPAKAAKLLKRAGSRVAKSIIDAGEKPEWNPTGDVDGYRVTDRNGRVVAKFKTMNDLQKFREQNKEKFKEQPVHEAVHSIDITPQVRELVKEGFAMYRKSRSLEDLLIYAAARAPKGGVSIDGKEYRGGQWIPGNVMDKASDSVKAKVKGAAQTHKLTRARRGPVDVADVKKRLAPHTKHKLTPAEKQSAARSLRALKDHHGDLVSHRIEELIAETEATHDAARGETKTKASRRLKILHDMLDEVAPKEQTTPDDDAADIEAIATKLKPYENEELTHGDVMAGVARWEAIKHDYGEYTPHHLDELADAYMRERDAKLAKLPKGAKESRAAITRDTGKQLALLAWMTDQWSKENAAPEPDFAEALDRISHGEKSRSGKTASREEVTSPWTAYLLHALANETGTEIADKRDEKYVAPEDLWNRLRDGKFKSDQLAAALKAIPREYGTMSVGQLRKILPHLKERSDTITPAIMAKVIPKAEVVKSAARTK